MGKIEISQLKPESFVQANIKIMVNWADWWEEWGDEIFDVPSVLLDIEPVDEK
jgi:hypothetical protein